MIRLDGQVALVTGAARGIGRACAAHLARAGARVAVNYRSAEAQARALVEEIRAAGGEARMYRGDVVSRAEVDRMVEAVRRELGPIDILVANAGISSPHVGSAETLPEAAWDLTLDVNLKGMWHCCAAVSAEMKERRKGRIILIASTSGLTGEPSSADYAASKGGIISLGKSLARDMGAYGVTVNCVSPGWVDTDMTSTELVGEHREKIVSLLPLGRIGRPEEIAGPVLFLASDLASYVTGQNLIVDGGDMPPWT